MGTYLTLHRCTGEAGQRDRQSRLSYTQKYEQNRDWSRSLPSQPICLYLPTLPSTCTLEHQVCPTVQSSPVHEPQPPPPPPPDAPSPRKQYIPGTCTHLAHPIPFSSHPTPAQPTCVHNNPCEIRLGRLGRRQHLCKIVPLRRYKYKYKYMYQRYYKLHALPNNMYIPRYNLQVGTYLKLKPGFAHSSSSCERTPQGGMSVGLFQLCTLLHVATCSSGLLKLL